MNEEREIQLRTIEAVLDPEEQEAFALRYFEQLVPDEITRLMGLSARSGARGVLQRARRKLAIALAPGGSHGA